MNLKIRSLNNATTLISDNRTSILIDPWIIGDLYYGSWSPTSTPKDLNFLKEVTHILISHLHEDHWDFETLKLVNKDVKIFIPEMKMNKVIERGLDKLGLKSKMLPLNTSYNLNEDFKIEFLEPLNALALSENYIKGYERDVTNIDTAILVNHNKTNSDHLLLCDNSPYDIEKLKLLLRNRKITTLFYPFNGFAQDYPLCFENFSIEERANISEGLSIERENFLIETLKTLKPKFIFPHSSDFIQNGPYKDLFNKIHPEEFLKRDLYASRVQKIIQKNNLNIKSLYLDSSDEAYLNNNLKIDLKKNKYETSSKRASVNLDLPSQYSENNEKIQVLVEKSLEKMFKRLNDYNLNLAKLDEWILEIKLEKNIFLIDFETKKLTSKKNNQKKILTLKTESLILKNLLTRKMHWNNAQIGSFLNWERSPNVFCASLYKSLNFFHI